MLNLHFSNRTEVLAERLLAALAADEGDPFACTELIVPSAALQRWLQLRIARRLGVCANLRVDFLAQWLWRLLAAQRADTPAQSPLAASVLAWRVLAAFGDAGWVATQPRLANYLAQADVLMRAELAQAAAALLEQYASWRPDWLQAWSEGRSVLPAHADEAWQAALWRRLAAELALPAQQPLLAFAQALQEGTTGAPAPRLPARVHVFAPPALPPLHQQLLVQLGAVMEVELYILNPCREYWFEIVDRKRLAHLSARGRDEGHEVGNPLLAAWGRQTQALVDGLVELGGEGIVDDGDYRPHPGRSLLAQLQNALLDLQPLGPGSMPLADGDRSLELHVCHSRTRELDVLHERLLALFAADPTLQPGDVLVVLPELEASAPLVEAVFGSTPAARRIPYTLTGRARSRAEGAARSLLALLDLLAARLPVSAVFELLQQPLLARRFALQADDLQQLHAWLLASGAHWGLDAAHRQACGQAPDARHTLLEGMTRLFLGHALPPGLHEPFAGRLPAADIGSSDTELLGRLWRFVQALQQAHAAAAQPRTPAAWAELLHALCARFFAAQDDERSELRELHADIDALAETMQRGGLVEPLPLPLLRHALQQHLDEGARGGVPSGAVTFAAMASLRALPYRVVCILGLDDGVFPSPARPAEFDLLAAQPRRGDRQRRLDERNLFLDLLLAARTHLHLSHTGRSVRDNAPLPPSVLVAELLDLLVPAVAFDPGSRASLAAARARLVVEHPLQPFSPTAFTPGADPRLRSHDEELAQALREAALAAARRALQGSPAAPANVQADVQANVVGVQENAAQRADEARDEDEDEEAQAAPAGGAQTPFFAAPLSAPGPEWRQPTLEQLERFFEQPCRSLLRRRLGLEIARDAEALEDEEPLRADHRAQRALAERLLPALQAGADAGQALRLALADPAWPGGTLGRVELARALPPLQALAARLREASAGPLLPPQRSTLDFDLDGETWTLLVGLNSLRAQGQLFWSGTALQARARLQAWIRHLGLCALAPPGVALCTRWLALDQELVLEPVADARAQLAQLLRLYRQGLTQPLHFYPRSAWAYVESASDMRKARQRWAPSHKDAIAEGEDPAYRLALRGVAEPLDEAFTALAYTVFGPLQEQLACTQEARA